MVNYNLKNPTVVPVPDPIDLDLAIQGIQDKLSVLTWLEKIFGRAREIAKKSADGKSTDRVPMVYQSNGEYYPPLPNDALKAYSFFVASQPRTFENSKPYDSVKFISTGLSLIVWGNLKRIDQTVDYIFTEQLINEVVAILNQNSRIELLRTYDENTREIFRGFTLDETHQGLMLHPYFAFRIDMNLRFTMKCPLV